MDPHAQFSQYVPDLPEGVVIVGLRTARQGDFEFLGKQIVKGIPRSSVQMIVRPAEGYMFKPQIETGDYIPVKIDPAKIAVVTFDVSKSEHAEFVKGLESHPSFIEKNTTAAPPLSQALKGSQVQITKSLEAPKNAASS
jgi:hypothetical protein